MKDAQTAQLPGRIPLAIGMQAMVTMNIATEADLANGSRGEINNIILDPREQQGSAEGVKDLQYRANRSKDLEEHSELEMEFISRLSPTR